ncbi:MAG: hypothetical protein DPW09_16305 [Anaerolineae bacterium]|nr:hypothetical protein [Anaerolineales bacterium]MCQ3975003.1 hypothetical protein [Anaerolineae bacterium]
MAKLPQIPRGIASHPYTVQNPEELPLSLQHSAEQALEPGESIQSIFVVPAQIFPHGWFGARYVPEQALLFTSQGIFHIQDADTPGQPASATYLRALDLLYTRLSLLLLYGQLELVGQARDILTHITVEFNTVGEHHLRPGLRHLVNLALSQTTALPASETEVETVWRELNRLPMKFANGLRYHGLQPGERLLGFVFQPDIWTRRWRFLPHQVSANTLLALTDRQLIILEEEKKGNQANYGWIFTFCPLAGVAAMDLKPAKTWPEVQIRLGRGGVTTDRRVTLEQEQARAWQALWFRYGGHGEEQGEPVLNAAW